MDKINLLIPMAGKGSRFRDVGYHMPKPLVMVDGTHILDWSFRAIDVDLYNLIFVVSRDHVQQFSIDQILRKKFGNDIVVVVEDTPPQGSISSCMVAESYINNDIPLAIYTLDVYFEPKFDWREVPNDSDGHILTFKANNPAYSYVKLDSFGHGTVVEAAEKQVISPHAATGIYYFKSGEQFCYYAKEMMSRNLRTRGEFYITPMYNLMIQAGSRVTTSEVQKMHVFGTPEELKFFQENVLRRFGDKPIALCSDHSGFNAKQIAMAELDQLGISYHDFGTYVNQDCDYNHYIDQVAEFIRRGDCNFGMGFCRTGQGVNIAANKHKGIRSALIFDEYTAEMSIRHNCANFFAVGEKYVDSDLMYKILKTLKDNTFDGGRHTSRISGTMKNENS